jgi:two-component system chemotaxis response regulator CheB
MFESLQKTHFSEIICVVLTGMGADGTKGITELKKHKKIYCISESEETCVVYGMPKSVVSAGLTDEVVPINKVAYAIMKKLGE